MSESNVDALKPIYAEWGQGNWRPRFDIYSPDMEWGWSDEFPGLGGVSGDPDLRSERLREWLSPWDHWRCEVEDFITAGDHVVALTRYSGRGKGSQVEVESLGAHHWIFRDGMVIRLEVFSSRDRAFAAAGLPTGP